MTAPDRHVWQLTDEELSLWIATKLEPKPTVPYWLESIEAWRFHYGTDAWVPQDFVNDPAMAVMLMERGKLSVQPLGDDIWMVGLVWMNGTVTMYTCVAKNSNLCRAVAESFCLANGWTP